MPRNLSKSELILPHHLHKLATIWKSREKKMDYLISIRRETCIVNDFRRLRTADGVEVLDINISNWTTVVDAIILANETKDAERIALTINGVNFISPALFSLLEHYVSPKLVELRVEECDELQWNHFRALLAPCENLTSLYLKNNKWVDDYVMEQFSLKFHKTLSCLVLEHLPTITNTALYQIGRRCSSIKVLKMLFCPKVNDFGLFELNKKNHLHTLHVSHNMSITDKSMEGLISSAKKMQSLSFVNCPNLSDNTIATLYESTMSWGKQRNAESTSIRDIELRDNYNFSYQMLIYISAQIPALEKLDIRDCNSIDLVRGMNELSRCNKIKELKLGGSGSEYRVNSTKFCSALLRFAPNLRLLHLEGILDFTDEHIAALIDESLGLKELSLINMNFGTLTIEALCSNVPNISKIVLVGSKIFSDKGSSSAILYLPLPLFCFLKYSSCNI